MLVGLHWSETGMPQPQGLIQPGLENLQQWGSHSFQGSSANASLMVHDSAPGTGSPGASCCAWRMGLGSCILQEVKDSVGSWTLHLEIPYRQR